MAPNEELNTPSELLEESQRQAYYCVGAVDLCLKVDQRVPTQSASRQTNAGALLSGANGRRSNSTRGFADIGALIAGRHSKNSLTSIRDAP